MFISPRHASHLANTWLRIMLPENDEPARRQGVEEFREWLRERFADNVRYDNLVGDLLVAPSQLTPDPRPAVFFTSLELKPEEIAASTARIFLGVQIQCAQCHDHPFDHWTQRDFWSYAAFFARLRQDNNAMVRRPGLVSLRDTDEGEVTLPETGAVVEPLYLGGVSVTDRRGTRRQQLAIWLTARENPYVAKAAVNRVWAHLFGRGLVEPIDDLRAAADSKHAVLLNELADYFKSTGFDLRDLFRVLANTQAYHRTSRAAAGADETQLEYFARMSVKSLTAEQIFDCLSAATTGVPNGGDDAQRAALLAGFRDAGSSATEFRSGIPQALTLMNGRLIQDATDLQQTGVLAAVEAPFFSDEQRVETLFLATLSRLPSDGERASLPRMSNRAAPATIGGKP